MTEYRATRALICRSAVFLCLAGTAVDAQTLQKRQDAEGNVHYGTPANPELCCMCQPALRYETEGGRTRFHLRYGIERAVANERVFLSEDGSAWYCEGAREMGNAGRKCGLVPPVM
ncbi:hypothetical protein [Nitratireductor sp. XY-223]|uniref:hypothetical protein n=1 Tax=Nitratireductor sp. XY-223 TaxID=2561926 RepID=UPI0010AA25A8|nr:hypothetical protein [Nitratireductor sp. XY-223]